MDLACSSTFSSADLVLREDGVCRLHPRLAKVIAEAAVSETEIQKIVTEFVNRLELIS
jgi:hypothetical protein